MAAPSLLGFAAKRTTTCGRFGPSFWVVVLVGRFGGSSIFNQTMGNGQWGQILLCVSSSLNNRSVPFVYVYALMSTILPTPVPVVCGALKEGAVALLFAAANLRSSRCACWSPALASFTVSTAVSIDSSNAWAERLFGAPAEFAWIGVGARGFFDGAPIDASLRLAGASRPIEG